MDASPACLTALHSLGWSWNTRPTLSIGGPVLYKSARSSQQFPQQQNLPAAHQRCSFPSPSTPLSLCCLRPQRSLLPQLHRCLRPRALLRRCLPQRRSRPPPCPSPRKTRTTLSGVRTLPSSPSPSVDNLVPSYWVPRMYPWSWRTPISLPLQPPTRVLCKLSCSL
jgi:hypothetical protein